MKTRLNYKQLVSQNQRQRAELLFHLYPTIEKAYKHTLEFRSIYEEAMELEYGSDFLH